jgi:hypothetical protein
MPDPCQPQTASAANSDIVALTAPAASVPAKPKKTRLSTRLATTSKKFAWRVTGVYVWFLVMLRLFGYSDVGVRWSHKLAEYLARAGFTPIDSSHLGRVARTITRKTTLGALPSAFEGGAFDFALFAFLSHAPKPFSRPNSRSTLIFDHSL